MKTQEIKEILNDLNADWTFVQTANPHLVKMTSIFKGVSVTVNIAPADTSLKPFESFDDFEDCLVSVEKFADERLGETRKAYYKMISSEAFNFLVSRQGDISKLQHDFAQNYYEAIGV